MHLRSIHFFYNIMMYSMKMSAHKSALAFYSMEHILLAGKKYT